MQQSRLAGSTLAVAALARLSSVGVGHCVLRPTGCSEGPPSVVEIDLLVERGARMRIQNALAASGFARLRAWGHAPHSFWVAYEAPTDRWIKLDVVDRLAFGRRVKCLRSELADPCLAARSLCEGVTVPDTEAATVALLLHCTLDKRRFSPDHCRELVRLLGSVPDRERLDRLLAEAWGPSLTTERLSALVAAGQWSTLLAERGRVARRLFWTAPAGTAARAVGHRLLRKLDRILPRLRGRLPRVAVLAPDGAGKTTLVGALVKDFFLPVRPIYMGLYGASGRRQTGVPGAGLALSLARQWWRYSQAFYHGLRGRLVVFDRYTYDALVGARQREGLHQRLRRWLLAHACPAPDLVVILDAPGSVLAARKPEHTAALLEQRRQRLLALEPRLGRCAVVDATAAPAEVRRKVTGLIWQVLICTSPAAIPS